MRMHGWMIFQLRHSDHYTDVLAGLHWLHVPECIQFEINVLAHPVLDETARVTWVRSSVCPIYRVGVVSGRSASTDHLVVPSFKLSTLAAEHLRSLLLRRRMLCRRTLRRHQRCPFFVKDLKFMCFCNLILTLFLNLNFCIYPQWLWGRSVT